MEEEIIDQIEDENPPSRYNITSFGADYDVEGIVSKVGKGKIFIPPFQRNYVWSIQRASRFIESLILGLPVPGIFLSTDSVTNKLLIVDGQQRILSLQKFYSGLFEDGKPFKLKGVVEELEGRTLNDLSEFDRNRLDESILHATVMKQEEPDDSDSSIYMIFERLNTGGVPLQPQEVRACVFYGDFNEFLCNITENKVWRSLFTTKNLRMKEEELILRFFAFALDRNQYRGNYKYFLNDFMNTNRNFKKYSKDMLEEMFVSTLNFVVSALGRNAFKISNQINAAIYDSVMIGSWELLKKNSTPDKELFNQRYNGLLNSPDYKLYVESTTSGIVAVNGRIKKSIETFTNL